MSQLKIRDLIFCDTEVSDIDQVVGGSDMNVFFFNPRTNGGASAVANPASRKNYYANLYAGRANYDYGYQAGGSGGSSPGPDTTIVRNAGLYTMTSYASVGS